MAGDEVGAGEEGVQGGDLARVAHRHEVDDVVVDDLHAHGFGEHAELAADVAVAYYPQGFAADLPALGGDFVPGSAVHFIVSVAELAGESDDFADDEFCDGAGVGEGGVEDADTVFGGVGEVDLVRANTEAADHDEVSGLGEDAGGQLRFGTDAEDVYVSEEGLV